jgi:hypothetical protein
VIAKEKSWFVKFDEDAVPDFHTLKQRLEQLSAAAHERLAGISEFFFKQIDLTEEFGGFLYAKEPK